MKTSFIYSISIFSILGLSSFFSVLHAQEKIKGIAMELVSSQKISDVSIKNVRTNTEVRTDQEGNFSIDAQINDYLAIEAVGYEKDTVYVYDYGVKRIYLNRENTAIELNEVYIERMTDSRLHAEINATKLAGKYADASQVRGGIRVSPSRVFGKNAKRARENYKLLIEEQHKRAIDRKFTEDLIQSLTPLKNPELALFKEQYRPSYKFIEQASKDDIKLYIIDSYKKFNTKTGK
ncbi:hypothetical protein LZQ00_05145 [Sphingobacterium sp. SRCM116780]|uniref:hypothetical protein n=1 Tax=Sphingobacterium sp. SRCM116780 TaxID=2907623 RepID=UPI001F3C7C6D|nr:hypothetical protein [Sphingobacterium sp. SRCM116780]UIR57199.1 hypothetical protein LZQ00_05145 [Sphingobacterium sp. SRCM116780]